MRRQDGARVARAAVAMGLAGTLAMPGAAWAAGGAEVGAAGGSADAPSVEKDEVVYVKAGADGATQGVYVVNVFDTAAAATVDDPGRYTRVKNLTTDDELVQRDGAVQVTTLSGEPFYYQGDLDAATVLPWDVSLTYYLDGKKTDPQALAGATGEVRIVLDVKARTDASASGVSDFAQSCLLQAQGTFSEESFGIEDAGDATVARAGSNALVTCMVLPGESATFEIAGQARGFEYAGWQISALPLSMAIDLASQDTSELSEQTGELEDATGRLADGASSLEDGLGSLADGSGALASGAGDVAAGASELASGSGDVAAGAHELQKGVAAAVDGVRNVSGNSAALLAGWNDLAAGVGRLDGGAARLVEGDSAFSGAVAAKKDQLAAGAAQLTDAQNAYASAMQNLQAALADPASTSDSITAAMQALDQAAQALAQASGAAGAYGALAEVEAGYAGVSGGIAEVAAGASDLSAGAASFAPNLESYVDGVDEVAAASPELKSGASNLSAGADDLSGGASALASGAGSAAQGASQLASGATDAASGASGLSSGAAALAEAVSGMDEQIVDELQKLIDEKLGAGFEAHSFVDPANEDVGDVQFVYVVEGVEEPEASTADDAEPGSEPQPEGLWDRLLALFRP